MPGETMHSLRPSGTLSALAEKSQRIGRKPREIDRRVGIIRVRADNAELF
jgi:hypothetical protein